MKVIANQDNELYLVEVSPGRARVVDLDKVFPEVDIQTLANGPWENFTGPSSTEAKILARVQKAMQVKV